ncbi:ATP-dependent chaperone ClpB, partial [Streptomyces sp. AV19]
MHAELTNRSREALNVASERAVSAGHVDVTPAHLLLALLAGQDNENIMDLLTAVEAEAAVLRSGAESLLTGLPNAHGSTVAPPRPSRKLLAVITAASQHTRALGDSFVSTEHLLIALAEKGEQISELMTRQRASAERLLGEFRVVRGGQRVTTADPEGTYKAL